MPVIEPVVQTVRIEIAPRSILNVLVMVGIIVLFYQLRVVVTILVVGLILAGTLHPAILWLERQRVRRLPALIIVFVSAAAIAALLIFLTVPSLADQITRALEDAPAGRLRLIAFLEQHNSTLPLARLVRDSGVAEILTRVQTYVFAYSTRALLLLGYGGTSLVLAFYLLADGIRAQGMIFALVPRDYHMRLARIIQHLERIVGGYMRGQLITCLAIGVSTFILLAAFRVPGALSLALFAAIVDVIPLIGGLLVIVPAVLSALPLGAPTAFSVLGALLLYMQFENRILVPRVYGEVLRLSATAVILALAAGAMLFGIIAALLALPVVAGLVMVVQELRVEMPGDDSMNDAERRRHAEAEATYEVRSAGSTAPEAGEIARDHADEIDAENEIAKDDPTLG
jgi:predicted PurR-regulated permease PerM